MRPRRTLVTPMMRLLMWVRMVRTEATCLWAPNHLPTVMVRVLALCWSSRLRASKLRVRVPRGPLKVTVRPFTSAVTKSKLAWMFHDARCQTHHSPGRWWSEPTKSGAWWMLQSERRVSQRATDADGRVRHASDLCTDGWMRVGSNHSSTIRRPHNHNPADPRPAEHNHPQAEASAVSRPPHHHCQGSNVPAHG